MARGGGGRSFGGGARSFGGGGRSTTARSSSSKLRRTFSAAKAPAKAPAPNAPPTQSVTGRVGSGFGNLGSSISEGIGWGVGSSVGHRAADAVLGPRTIHVETIRSAPAATTTPGFAHAAPSNGIYDACSLHMKAFSDCVSSNGSDISKCQFYMDMLIECKRNSGGAEMSAQASAV